MTKVSVTYSTTRLPHGVPAQNRMLLDRQADGYFLIAVIDQNVCVFERVLLHDTSSDAYSAVENIRAV